MDSYPSNSNLSKEKARRAVPSPTDPHIRKKVIEGEAVTTNRAGTSRLFGIDKTNKQNLVSYTLYDLMIPTFKKLAYNIGMNFLYTFIFQSLAPGSFLDAPPGTNEKPKPVPYSRFHNDRPNDEYYKEVAKYPSCNLKLDNIYDAEDILLQLQYALDEFGIVSIGDLYDAAGLSTFPTYYSWGWKNISAAKITRSLNGYILSMPKPVFLD